MVPVRAHLFRGDGRAHGGRHIEEGVAVLVLDVRVGARVDQELGDLDVPVGGARVQGGLIGAENGG